jgi:hypothetical protein
VRLTAVLGWNDLVDDTGHRRASICKNGTGAMFGPFDTFDSTAVPINTSMPDKITTHIITTPALDVNAADYFEVWAFHVAGADKLFQLASFEMEILETT